MTILALTGGVGGAKLCLGLAQQLSPDEVTFVVNVGDDFEHCGLHISPDIDTLTYTLADMVSSEHGWGRENESWDCMDELEKLDGETWFRLGDRDLATHLYRTHALKRGKRLSEVTQNICKRFGVKHPVLPATDVEVRTIVRTADDELNFQDYFVRLKCEPKVTEIWFKKKPFPFLPSAVNVEDVDGVIISPSNPFLSIDPMLEVEDLSKLLRERTFPVVAVSPIVGDRAIKGPTAKMMQELDMPSTCVSVAEHYQGLIDGFVLDVSDEKYANAVQALGMRTKVTPSIMTTLEEKVALADECIAFLDELR